MNSKNHWEEEVYKRRMQWNLWPYPEVLSTLKRLRLEYPHLGNTLIEIGSGVGNNLLPIAQYGMNCFGVDISETAILEAKSRAQEQSLSVSFSIGNIENLDFDGNFSDYILDRSVLTCTDEETIMNSIKEIHRVLKPGGIFFAFDWFGQNHPDLNYGEKIAPNTYCNFERGRFKNVSSIYAFNFEILNRVLKEFENLKIVKITATDSSNKILEEKFNFIALKAP